MFRLDWAKRIMILLLHVTCSCIFHTYIPSFLYILILIYWYSSISLSLSLSMRQLALWHLSVNLLRPETIFVPRASSSSSPANSTPSHVWFYDDKARKEFSKNFSRCGIHSERQVILLDFSDTNLSIVIYSRGWESLCGIFVTCPSMIIQEFYSNMHGFDYYVPLFVTRV